MFEHLPSEAFLGLVSLEGHVLFELFLLPVVSHCQNFRLFTVTLFVRQVTFKPKDRSLVTLLQKTNMNKIKSIFLRKNV